MGQTKNQFPGGCYLGFSWALDRQSVARLVEMVAMAHAEGYERVDLMLSSSGGLLVDAHYAVECLAAMPIKLVVWNMSAVQSAATMLFALGVERYATPGSSFGFHQTGFEGVAGQRNSETEIKEQLRLIELADQRSAAFIAERTGIPVEEVVGWQRSSRTLTENEAVEARLIHAVQRPQIPKDAFVRQILPNFAS